jgi:hypothetical protein
MSCRSRQDARRVVEPEPEFAHRAVHPAGISTGPCRRHKGSSKWKQTSSPALYVHRARGGAQRGAVNARSPCWTELTPPLAAAGRRAADHAPESSDPVPFPDDSVHAEYDAAAAPVLEILGRAGARRVRGVPSWVRRCASSGATSTSRRGQATVTRRHAPFLDGTCRADRRRVVAGDDTFPGLRSRLLYPKGDGIEDAASSGGCSGTPSSASTCCATTTCAAGPTQRADRASRQLLHHTSVDALRGGARGAGGAISG